MKLPLYSSTAETGEPNLVGLQHPALSMLPTELVCPMRRDIAETPLRASVLWKNKKYLVACDLIRPINRRALKPIGELEEETSSRILSLFQRMLAHPDDA